MKLDHRMFVTMLVMLAPYAAQAQPRRRRPPTPVPVPAVPPSGVTFTPASPSSLPVAPSAAPVPQTAPDAHTTAGGTHQSETRDPNASGFLLVSVAGGYGFLTGRSADPNFYGPGIGGRVSYTFAAPYRVSIGVEGFYHFGYSQTLNLLGTTYMHEGHSAYFGGTLGGEATAGPVTARFYGLAGALAPTRDGSGEPVRPMLGAGIALRFMTSVVFLGIDGRLMAMLGGYDPELAGALFAEIGFRVH